MTTTMEKAKAATEGLPLDPSPSIAAAADERPSAVARAQASVAPGGRFSQTPAIPRGKNCRVIRVKTAEGVVVLINAADYDPDEKGHEALTPEDKKWGMLAVESKQRADYESERLASIKRAVRGG